MPHRFAQRSSTASFTLIELLIVIGILGVLAAAVVVVLNPIELLKQGRDGRRVSEIQSLSHAVKDALLNSISLGTSNTVYVSLPDVSSTCNNLSLPALPSGWSYRCIVAANLQKVDGTGWLPINLTTLPGGSPLATLPIDPENNASSTLYYTYAVGSGNTYELTDLMESKKYASLQATDGGPDMAMYEAGSNLAISPFLHGL
ncbi:MAG: prepilin-type N-terminal cleavage/methylation domain-containing protein, partial [bacterium]|nr:prepilin-type N-terminal cleavage/methylation domain-containing protein [bacterium]